MSLVAIYINKTETILISDNAQTILDYLKCDNSQNLQDICKLEKFGDIIIGSSVGNLKTIQLAGMFIETNKLNVFKERDLDRFFIEFKSLLKKL